MTKAEHFHLSTLSLIFSTLGLSLGVFIEVLDSAIANVALANIAGSFSIPQKEAAWVITSFGVSNAIALPIVGWLSKNVGEIRLFLWCIFLFSISSLFCGLANNLEMLVLFRIVQGFTAGPMTCISQSVIYNIFPPDKKNIGLGIWGMVIGIAPIVGPVLGGIITDRYSWPWVFYINVPLGFASGYLVWKLLSKYKSPIVKTPIDWIGLIFMIIGVSSLQIFLEQGNDYDWFNSTYISCLGISSIIFLALFIGWNFLSRNPIVDFSFFKDSNFVVGTLLSSVGYTIFFCSLALFPIWLQGYMGYTPLWVGISTAPITLVPLITFIPLGAYMHRFSFRALASLSFFLLSLSCFLFSKMNTQISVDFLMQLRLFQGSALVFFYIPLLRISLSSIPNHMLTSAAGVYNFLRLLIGTGFGVAIFLFLSQRRDIFHHARLAESITPYHSFYAEISKLGEASFFSKEEMFELFNFYVDQQASTMAVTDLYWISGFIYLLFTPLIYLTNKKS